MARVDSLKEQLALTYASEATYASLHTGDPGTTGANELSGVTRQALTWNAGSADGVVTSQAVIFTLPAGTVLTHVGIWSAVTGGEFLDSVANAIAFDAGGVYSITLTFTQS